MSELRVFPRHARAAKICMRGSRKWFAANGLNWNEFVERGISADHLRLMNDPIANRALAVAEAEESEAPDGR